MDTTKRRQLLAFIMGGIVFLVFGCIGLYYGLHEWQIQNALDASGITTQATVTDLYSIGGRSSAYYVDYQFQTSAPGVTYRGNQAVDEGFYNTLQRGNTIVIRYVRDNPTISGISGQERGSVAILFFTPITLFAGIVLLFGAYRLIRQLTRAQREAMPM